MWVKSRVDGGRDLALLQALASNRYQATGDIAEGEEPLLSHKKVSDRAPRQVELGFVRDTKILTMSLPVWKIRKLQEMLKDFPEERNMATVPELVVLSGKLYNVAYVIRPRRYFLRRFLQLDKLHMNGKEKGRHGEVVGRRQQKEGLHGRRGVVGMVRQGKGRAW